MSEFGGHRQDDGEYRTILADPPRGTRNQKGGYGAVRHYPLIPVEEIGRLAVSRFAAADAHLWMW